MRESVLARPVLLRHRGTFDEACVCANSSHVRELVILCCTSVPLSGGKG